MINICLCDDDLNYLNYYSTKINELADIYHIPIMMETYTSGESLTFELEDNPNRIDIVIIDIIMKKLNGIEAGQLLRKFGYIGIIIFLTSSKEYALDSFSVEPFNYLIKDLRDEEQLKGTFLRAMMEVEKKRKKSIMISSKQTNKLIKLDNILYIESIGKKVILYNLSGEKEELNTTLNSLAEKINEYGFIRCHKSYIVNTTYISSFNKSECSLKQGITIPIGRKYSSTFKENYLKNELDHILL